MFNTVQLQEYVFKWMLQNIQTDKEIFFGGVYGVEYQETVSTDTLTIGTDTLITELSSNQEDADDRIMFHNNDGVVK